MEGCARGVVFGPDGTLYRRGCDKFVYKYRSLTKSWQKLWDKKVYRLASSEDGLWVIDLNRAGYLYEESIGKFIRHGMVSMKS